LTFFRVRDTLHELPRQRVVRSSPVGKVVTVDDLSFDQLVKRLSAQSTRRMSLQALAGGALASGLLADASTYGKKKKKKCKAPKVKCGRKRCCAAGQQCVDGACVTPATSTSGSTSTTTSTTTSQPSVCTPPCEQGLQCVNETCTCDGPLCAALTNPDPERTDCFCGEVFTGQTLCLAGQLCAGAVACGAGGSCAAGFVCQMNACGTNICVKTCS